MRVLVTGAAGFAGNYAVNEFIQAGHEVVCFDRHATGRRDIVADVTGDLLDEPLLRDTIRTHGIDACLHLAGIAFVPMGWDDPHLVMRVNAHGVIALLESFKQEAPEARVLVVTSAEVYGREAHRVVREDDPLTPSNLYAVSKIAADSICLLYARHHNMHVMTARPQNHIGPGQDASFAVSAFAERLLALQQLSEPHVMHVGNLDSKRDFTDVRDVVRAYRLLIEQGHAGEAYNIASGQTRTLASILDMLCTIAGLHPERRIDSDLFRATDEPPELSLEKIKAHTGWQPVIPLTDTLRDIYNHLRQHPDTDTQKS